MESQVWVVATLLVSIVLIVLTIVKLSFTRSSRCCWRVFSSAR